MCPGVDFKNCFAPYAELFTPYAKLFALDAKLFALYAHLLRSFCGVKVWRRAGKISVGGKTVNVIDPWNKKPKACLVCCCKLNNTQDCD